MEPTGDVVSHNSLRGFLTTAAQPHTKIRNVMRRHVAILPKDDRYAHDAGDLLTEILVPKRRRVGVSVACNSCRRRKIRCDGQRPICSNCKSHTATCTYRDDSELSEESKLLLLEVIRLVNAISNDEVLEKLQTLRNEVDPSVILATLRQKRDIGVQLPDTFSVPIRRGVCISDASQRCFGREHF